MSAAPPTSVPIVPRNRAPAPTAATHTPPQISAGYFRNNASPYLMGWNPVLREASEDVRASWSLAAARAVDQIQNSGFISGMCEVSAALVIGPGLRLACKPDWQQLGWTQKQGQEWSSLVERRFVAWAEDPVECDAAGRMTFGQMQDAQYLAWLGLGEMLALTPVSAPRRTSAITKVMNLPATRISQETREDANLLQGVYVDRSTMMARGYKLEGRDRYQGVVTRDLLRFDRDGRAMAIHLFDPGFEVTRGISKFAPVIKTIRQMEQYWDATHIAALLQTIFAATVKTNMTGLAAFDGLMTQNENGGSLDLAKFLETKNTWYEAAKIDMTQHGRVTHLMPNEELQFHKAQDASQQFDIMMQWLTRECALAAGVTYESGTGDYRQATYSSINMGIGINAHVLSKRRKGPPTGYCQGVYECWLEDEIGIGSIPFPGGLPAFYANRQAACGASWSGPPKPQADAVKTARAHQTLMQIGATTLEAIAAEYGMDWEDMLEQKARENQRSESLELGPVHISPLDPLMKRKEMGDAEDKTDDPSYATEGA